MKPRTSGEAVEVALALESRLFDRLLPSLDQLRCFPRLGAAVAEVEPDGLRYFPGLLPTGSPLPGAPPAAPRAVRMAIPWNLELLDLPRCWDQGITGEGVRVGHLDTGVDGDHPALRDRVADFCYFDLDGDPVAGTPVADASGHGTHTAGTICGGVVDSVAVGAAPGAKLCSAVVIEGGKSLVRALCGLDWLLDRGVRVVCMALGTPTPTPIFEIILARLCSQGVLPVMPVGNHGPGRTTSPGNYPWVLSVGALDRDRQPARFSGSSARKPEVAAPGVEVVSAQRGGGLAACSGTSMAAAHVAGIAALLFQVRPEASVGAVERAIIDTARALPPAATPGADRRGFARPGLVDPLAAIARLCHA